MPKLTKDQKTILKRKFQSSLNETREKLSNYQYKAAEGITLTGDPEVEKLIVIKGNINRVLLEAKILKEDTFYKLGTNECSCHYNLKKLGNASEHLENVYRYIVRMIIEKIYTEQYDFDYAMSEFNNRLEFLSVKTYEEAVAFVDTAIKEFKEEVLDFYDLSEL